jgi:S1-C subfamily serine protease
MATVSQRSNISLFTKPLPKRLMRGCPGWPHTEAMSTTTAITDLSGLSHAIVDLIHRTSHGVVAVRIAPHRVASGVSIRENLVAIADHTLRRNGQITVSQIDGTEGKAALLGRDPTIDVALLRVEDVKLQPLSAADPSTFRPGVLAAVVGLTMDVGPSASLGILGAIGGARHTWRGGMLDSFVRLDVNLYPSQSGAAVVNPEGQLIGLATPALLRHSAVAVPVSTLNRVAEELLKQGRIRQGYLGVGLQQVSLPQNLREKLKAPAEWGLILLSVEPDSPAGRAKLQVGDILVALDERPVGDVDELQIVLRGETVGRTVTAALIRGGEPIELPLTITEREKTEK